MDARTVIVVGSGFAGTILARLLASRGRRVTLLERGTHPRFAIGESSTPLAALCLERLARDYRLPDLAALAAYGRWGRELPGLRRGLKRGFTFYAHSGDQPFANDAYNARRLLVAASPDDEIADAHWLRADIDAHLVARAVDEGVEYIDRCELDGLERMGDRWRVEGRRGGRRLRLDAEFLVDASGAGGFAARHLPIGNRIDVVASRPDSAPKGAARPPNTGLVFGHFEAVGSFAAIAEAGGAVLPPAPYPEERAAIHHLLEEGWMYVLPFDDGLVSAGFLVDREHPEAAAILAMDPEDSWSRLIERYPTLREQFADARTVRPIGSSKRLQRLLDRATAPGLALLPHTFCFASPMFSTGIAWSLAAVERLAGILAPDSGEWPTEAAVEGYGELLRTEAETIMALTGSAVRLRGDFEAFRAWTHLYFAAASYSEAWQRLCPAPEPGGWVDIGFLGATDPVIRGAIRAASSRLARGHDDGHRGRRDVCPVPNDVVAALIAPRNVAGLADPSRAGAYPVDLDALVEHASLLGLTRAEVRQALPRLRRGSGP
ncbi:MAG: NAD(P)/FAD-dependent oxidoreductase [Gemmatimonadota bacterium]